MASRERGSLTIGQIMWAVVAIALVFGLYQGPGSSLALTIGAIGAVLLAITIAVAVVDGAIGLRCPRCGDLSVSRTLVYSFGDRFFRCNKCQMRGRRGFLTGWSDASGPEFDPFFARRRDENPWTAPPGLEDEDLIYSKTHGNLLANKMRRHPNPPDQGKGRGA